MGQQARTLCNHCNHYSRVAVSGCPMRSLPEWKGKTDDTPIPDRVRLRVFSRVAGRCAKCTCRIMPGDNWQCDHIIPLIQGGQNSENNLQPLCSNCHRRKTNSEVSEKSRVYRIALKHFIGSRKTSKRPIFGSKASGWRKKMDGSIVPR